MAGGGWKAKELVVLLRHSREIRVVHRVGELINIRSLAIRADGIHLRMNCSVLAPSEPGGH
jgi:hypothetical protein